MINIIKRNREIPPKLNISLSNGAKVSIKDMRYGLGQWQVIRFNLSVNKAQIIWLTRRSPNQGIQPTLVPRAADACRYAVVLRENVLQ